MLAELRTKTGCSISCPMKQIKKKDFKIVIKIVNKLCMIFLENHILLLSHLLFTIFVSVYLIFILALIPLL